MRKPVALTEERIFSKIYVIRDQKILLDADLADLYKVETKRLKEAVRRNLDRFPDDFMFQLTREEFENLRTQIASSSWGGTRYMPMAFTEQGVAMLSSVLKSAQAIAVNIQIMRVFVRMRQMITTYKDLLEKIEKLEASDKHQNKNIKNIYDIIKGLLEPAVKEQRPIGFRTKSTEG